MELNKRLRERFCKDYRIPIFTYDDENYSYFRNIYDFFYEITKKEEMMNSVVTSIGNNSNSAENEYFNYSNKVNSSLKEIIRNTQSYKSMCNLEMKSPVKNQEIPKNKIYTQDYVNRRMISVDLNKANFNVLNMFGLCEELHIANYQELVKKVTPYDYFIKSNMTRKVVFGDLNPTRQQAIQKSIIREFANIFNDNNLEVHCLGSDEIIIMPKDDLKVKDVRYLLKDVDESKSFFRIEEFSFEKIHKDLEYYFKTSIKEDGTIKKEFKSVPSLYFAQVFKMKFNMPIEDKDLLFELDGKLAKFLEPLVPELKKDKIKSNKIK